MVMDKARLAFQFFQALEGIILALVAPPIVGIVPRFTAEVIRQKGGTLHIIRAQELAVHDDEVAVILLVPRANDGLWTALEQRFQFAVLDDVIGFHAVSDSLDGDVHSRYLPQKFKVPHPVII